MCSCFVCAGAIVVRACGATAGTFFCHAPGDVGALLEQGNADARDEGVCAAIEIYEELGIRCIFASAHADSLVRQRAERAHPLGWLNKPYASDALVKAVASAVSELRARS